MSDINQVDRERVLRMLQQWVNCHPDPDGPIIGAADGSSPLTPRTILESVRRDDEAGKEFLRDWFEMMSEQE
jgi:hypothetical protein